MITPFSIIIIVLFLIRINIICTAFFLFFLPTTHNSTKQPNALYESGDDEVFNWMVKRRFVPKSLDTAHGHKVLRYGSIENGTVLRRLKY